MRVTFWYSQERFQMRKVLFQASRTIKKATLTEKAIVKKQTLEVEIPLTMEELGMPPVEYPSTIKITIGYDAMGKRIKEEVPFVVGMYLEGLKLYVGKDIAAEAEEEDEELNDALAKLTQERLEMAEFGLSLASGKKRKELRDKIVNGKF